jgi:small subunit ribosomal protein S17
MEQTRKNPRVLEGVVTSDKMTKTIVVLVETHKKHTKYAKRVKYAKKYYVHDENEIATVGDKVEIAATRPLSALKRWRLVRVVTKAIASIKEAEAALAQADQDILNDGKAE